MVREDAQPSQRLHVRPDSNDVTDEGCLLLRVGVRHAELISSCLIEVSGVTVHLRERAPHLVVAGILDEPVAEQAGALAEVLGSAQILSSLDDGLDWCHFDRFRSADADFVTLSTNLARAPRMFDAPPE